MQHRVRSIPIAAATAAFVLFTPLAAFAGDGLSRGAATDPSEDVVVYAPQYDPARISDLTRTQIVVRKQIIEFTFEFHKLKAGSVQGALADLSRPDKSSFERSLRWGPSYQAGIYKPTRTAELKRLCAAEIVRAEGKRGTISLTVPRSCLDTNAGGNPPQQLTARRIAVEGWKNNKLKWRDTCGLVATE